MALILTDMRTSRFSESQIVGLLKEHAGGVATADICRREGISAAIFYNWKAKYGGMELSEVKRTRELEAENARLKQLFAELSLENHALKDLIAKKL